MQGKSQTNKQNQTPHHSELKVMATRDKKQPNLFILPSHVCLISGMLKRHNNSFYLRKTKPGHNDNPTASNQFEIHFPSHIIPIRAQISTCRHSTETQHERNARKHELNVNSDYKHWEQYAIRVAFTLRAQKMQESSMHLCVVNCRKLLRKISRCQRTCNGGIKQRNMM